MKELRIIIAGGRDFNNMNLLEEYFKGLQDELGLEYNKVICISGTARGADKLGEEYAKFKGWEIERYPADWSKYGKSAGYIRNKQMADVGNILVAFWDEKSRGTKSMIDIAKSKSLKVYICRYST